MEYEWMRIDNLILMKRIEVLGTYTTPSIAKGDLVFFQSLLTAAFPGAKVKINTSYNPSAFGAADVQAEPVAPPWNEDQSKHFEKARQDIDRLWRIIVSRALPTPT